jgi:dephospho-CoA kinase
MLAVALVGLPFSGRQIVADGLSRRGFISFPINELMQHRDAVEQILKSMGGNLVIPDVSTPEQVSLVRSAFGARVLGVRASTGTRLERAQLRGALDNKADFAALDQLDTQHGYDHSVLREIDAHLDAVVLTDVQQDLVVQNVEKIVTSKIEGRTSTERG